MNIQDFVPFILLGISLLASVIGFLVNLIRGNSVKKSVSDLFAEVSEIYSSYKGGNTMSKYSQTFSPYVDDYYYDENKGELKKRDIPLNVQERINSYRGQALAQVLAKFEDVPEEEDDVEAEYFAALSDIDSLTEAMQVIEEYRMAFQMPSNATPAQVIKAVEAYAKDVKSEVNARKAEIAAKAVAAKEVKNETQKNESISPSSDTPSAS